MAVFCFALTVKLEAEIAGELVKMGLVCIKMVRLTIYAH